MISFHRSYSQPPCRGHRRVFSPARRASSCLKTLNEGGRRRPAGCGGARSIGPPGPTSAGTLRLPRPVAVTATGASDPPANAAAFRGHRQNGFALEPGERGFFGSESNLPRLKSTHVADCKPQAPPGRRWPGDFALELGLGLLVQNIREPAGWLRS